jgi:hypothetical protein
MCNFCYVYLILRNNTNKCTCIKHVITTLIPSMFRIYLDAQVTKCMVLSGVNAQKCDISNLCCALTSRVLVMGESCQNVRFLQFLVSLT